MALYRARPHDGVAWITGASTGIGRALALELAGQGHTVAATARSAEKLEELVEKAKPLAGKILAFPGDVTVESDMADCVAAIEKDAGPITLAVFNAGNYFPTRGERLETGNFVRTYEINVFGVINGCVHAVNRMKRRRKGHVLFVASASGYGGLPLASAYGASKAAVINMAEALKFDFDKMNIRIQVVVPGFVETPLTEGNRFPMPALMQADDAARRIAKGIARGGFELSFPRRFTWWLKLVNLLPYPLYFEVMNRFMGWRKRPLRF